MKISIKKVAATCLLLSAAGVACNNADSKKVAKGNIEVAYKDGITAEQAQHLLDLLDRENGNTAQQKETRKAEVLLRNDTVVFRMIAKDENTIGSIPTEVLWKMANKISDSVFAKKPVAIEVADKKFRTARAVAFKKMESFGELVKVGTIDLYYLDGITAEHAESVATFMNRMHYGQKGVFQAAINKTGNDITYILRMFLEKDKADLVDVESLRGFVKQVSDSTYNGKPLVFEITDKNFNAYKSVTHPGQ